MTRTVRLLQRIAWLAVPCLALTASGCGGSSSSSTSPDETPPSVSTEYYAGTLDIGGSGSYAFTVAGQGALHVTLTSLTTTQFSTQTTNIRLGVGIPQGEGCAVTHAVTTGPGLSTQLLDRLDAGIYCVEVRDPGVLKTSVSFVVQITHS